MNLSLKQAIKYCQQLNHSHNYDLVIAPPAIYLLPLIAQFPKLKFAAQDVSRICNEYGAFTGELSAKFLANSKVKYCFIGHSERKEHCNESEEIIGIKINNAIEANLTPIICINEAARDEMPSQKFALLEHQLDMIYPTDSEIVIAYEPIWAIGSGTTASIEYIEEIITFLRVATSKVAKNFKLVYGGSVNSVNHKELLKISNLDGVVIGSAALKRLELNKIIYSHA